MSGLYLIRRGSISGSVRALSGLYPGSYDFAPSRGEQLGSSRDPHAQTPAGSRLCVRSVLPAPQSGCFSNCSLLRSSQREPPASPRWASGLETRERGSPDERRVVTRRGALSVSGWHPLGTLFPNVCQVGSIRNWVQRTPKRFEWKEGTFRHASQSPHTP